MTGKTLTKALAANAKTAEQRHLPALVAAYADALRTAGTVAARQFFTLTAAADWQPPPEGLVLTAAALAALERDLNAELAPLWKQVVVDVAKAPLARIGIDWNLSHPVPRALVDRAATRTGGRLNQAAQLEIRKAIDEAYAEGLSVRDTAARISASVAEAAPWQAEMLARTDLVSLSNGASLGAAQATGVGFKTWLTAEDDRVRDTHAAADGQTVPINDVFTVGLETADYPAAPELSDGEACGCRCVCTYSDSIQEAGGMLADGGAKMKAVTIPSTFKGQHSAELVAAALLAAPMAVAFDGVAAIEGKISDDNSIAPRVLLPMALTWPELPVPFMAQTVTAEGHDGAEVAGRVDSFARKNAKGRMQMIGVDGELTTPFGINEIAPMVADKTLRFVSIDIGAGEWAVVKRSDLSEVPEEDLTFDDIKAGKYAIGLTSGKIKALTLVPTPAIEGAMIALTASADGKDVTITFPMDLTLREEAALVASAAPLKPPAAWFTVPEPPGKMPLTITKQGRVFGHLATWDSCHVGFLGNGNQCVPPPRSPSNYAYFHVCELDSAEGDPLTVGKLMFSPGSGGHADRSLTAQRASAYYDRTGMAAAYLRVVDGEYGIWACGSINPSLSDEQRSEMRRELRLHPPSGDWRPINGNFELICGLAVAVPGFPVPRAGATVTVTASADGAEIDTREAIIASSGFFEADVAALEALDSDGLLDGEADAERRMHVLAARAEGLEALAGLVE